MGVRPRKYHRPPSHYPHFLYLDAFSMLHSFSLIPIYFCYLNNSVYISSSSFSLFFLLLLLLADPAAVVLSSFTNLILFHL